MFDITSSKLLLLGIVALLVIGPKDFPALLRTIGKYVGIVRGHAKEFRAQFDEAMRESELTELKKDVENIARETEASLQATGQTVEKHLDDTRQTIHSSLDPTAPETPTAPAITAEGLPAVPPLPALVENGAHGANGASHTAEPGDSAGHQAPEPGRPVEKSGA